MADNTQLPASSSQGDIIATEDIGAYKIPVSKIRTGATDVDGGDVTSSNPFPTEALSTDSILAQILDALKAQNKILLAIDAKLASSTGSFPTTDGDL